MGNIRSEIAPKGLQFYPSEFNISDQWATILTVVSYPKFIDPGYLSSLTSITKGSSKFFSASLASACVLTTVKCFDIYYKYQN